MANLCCITKEVWKSSNSLSDFKSYKGKLSREDVATLIETFEFAVLEAPVELFVDVLKNSDGFFAFLVDKNSDCTFDFYKYLNDYFTGSTIISPVNAKFVFSRSLSRGIYSEYAGAEEEDSPSSDMEEETPTGYMDEEDLSSIKASVNAIMKYIKTGAIIHISQQGTIIGRSQKSADFVLSGNTNVSRPHAKVYLDGTIVKIHDENSKNGTFVNGEKVYPNKDVILSDGDVVMLADEKFVVSIQ